MKGLAVVHKALPSMARVPRAAEFQSGTMLIRDGQYPVIVSYAGDGDHRFVSLASGFMWPRDKQLEGLAVLEPGSKLEVR